MRGTFSVAADAGGVFGAQFSFQGQHIRRVDTGPVNAILEASQGVPLLRGGDDGNAFAGRKGDVVAQVRVRFRVRIAPGRIADDRRRARLLPSAALRRRARRGCRLLLAVEMEMVPDLLAARSAPPLAACFEVRAHAVLGWEVDARVCRACVRASSHDHAVRARLSREATGFLRDLVSDRVSTAPCPRQRVTEQRVRRPLCLTPSPFCHANSHLPSLDTTQHNNAQTGSRFFARLASVIIHDVMPVTYMASL